jgi:NAD(P)-dependent dehydrogenase (short-subunit alcohol dehydrogenase family)
MSERRTALVTSANRGIGLEVCRQLASRGLRVILTARDRAKAERAAADLRGDGGEVFAEVLDVTDPRSLQVLKQALAARNRPVDVVVNNAAILVAESRSVIDTPIDILRTTFETNLFGAIAVAQAFVPAMIARRYGRVVNVSSQAGQLASMGTYAPAYSMSKTALNAFTRQLAASTRGSGVHVNSACPGWVRTDMGGAGAPMSVSQGADTIVWLATQSGRGPSGRFFSERREIDW